jgi:hypothetical protein
MIERNYALLWELLSTSSCSRCGVDDPEVLQFDHRDPSVKFFNISEAVYSLTWETISLEIEKCDIVCANCHRKRTIHQFGQWRSRMARNWV